MTEKLTNCGKCDVQLCSEVSNVNVTIWVCFACGFTSNTTITDKNVIEMESTLPELYKALKYKDKTGKYWYPNSVMLDNKSMVFAEGTSIEDWKWSAVPSENGKPNMLKKKEFDHDEFANALKFIGYFN